MPRLRVTHLATGRTLVGSPDELLDRLAGWWPDDGSDDAGVDSTITQAVYAWEQGVLDGAHGDRLGVRAELI
jgi:alkanesulfonate monooxygenase SsuD/methylene tetrahydromethanopterin reductase-like flavin-dependent oxidoreductase (luciferase family)